MKKEMKFYNYLIKINNWYEKNPKSLFRKIFMLAVFLPLLAIPASISIINTKPTTKLYNEIVSFFQDTIK